MRCKEHGSISAAAKALGLSYRHVWGELKRWEAELGHTLIVWDKGQPARLSEFGDEAAVGRAPGPGAAGAADRIPACRPGARLRRGVRRAAHVLTLFASHDDALAALREHAAANAQLHLDIRFCGSVDAISALNEGRCVVAGFHTPPAAAAGLARAAHLPAAAAAGAAQADRLRPPQPGPDGGAGQSAGPGVDRRSGAAARALRQPGAGHRHAGAARRTAGAVANWPRTTSRATATRSPRTRPWRRPWLQARPTRAWASRRRRARAGWISCRCCRRTTTSCA